MHHFFLLFLSILGIPHLKNIQQISFHGIVHIFLYHAMKCSYYLFKAVSVACSSLMGKLPVYGGVCLTVSW